MPERGEAAVTALEEIWASLADACRGLSDEQWDAGTECPGWAVRDHVAHVVGTERMLLGDAAPPPADPLPDYVHNAIGEMNEAWVVERRAMPGTELLAELEAVTRRRLAQLDAFEPERFDVVGWSPIGDVPYRQFMEIRAFDCWIHEQDVRRAVGRPGGRGGAGEAITVRRLTQALPYVVGRQAGAPDGTRVGWHLGDGQVRELGVAVEGGRGRALDAAPSEPSVTISLDTETLWRLGAGRVAGADALRTGLVEIDGDVEIGRRILDSMNIVP